MSRAEELLVRCAPALLAIGIATHVATTRAPSAAATTPIPTVASASPAPARGGELEEVAIRLTEHLGDADVTLPGLTRGLADLETHWRRMQAPWKDTAGQPRARLVQLVALRTSATEIAHTVQTKTGAVATFDVRKWNMSEGAFAQREAIFAPTPSTLRFRLRVPLGAALELAPAVLPTPTSHGDVTFTARAVPTSGGAVEIGKIVVRDRDRWTEQRFDLSALAGKEIDLELLADAPEPALALWGTPRIVRRAPSKLPYNVLWIVVDSLRPDVIPSFHDPAADAAKRAAKRPPLDTLLPVVPGLTPAIDALAKRSAIFRNAISPAPWTRAGTVGMFTGVHARQLGLPSVPWSLVDAQVNDYYRHEPPLFPLAMRRAGAATRAFVNNNFMLGYAAVGLDMGFEHVEDYRYRTADTAEITRAALAGLRAHAGERFFHFVNYNSPHEPFDPPAECVARLPSYDPKRPDPVKLYMAEACKDDGAIGELMAELDRLGLRDKTVVVLTADHGETLSERHEGVAVDLDEVNTRFHHAFGMWEETTRIPILLSLPGVIPEGRAVDGRVSNLDLAPTLLSLLGLERDPRQAGLDLVAAARGKPVPDRAIVTLGRGSAAVFVGRYRFVSRDKQAQKWLVGHGKDKELLTIPEELYDLVDDPGETHNLALVPAFASTVAEMRARLRAALAGVATADDAPPSGEPAQQLLLRFSGAGRALRVHATITATGARELVATPFGIEKEAIRVAGDRIELATTTAADALVGIDLSVSPEATPLQWTLALEDKPLADDAVFGGVLGVSTKGLAKGLLDPVTRATISAPRLPFIDPEVDRGVFVVRLGGPEALAPERATSAAAAAEVKSALQQWGYAK